MRYCVAMATKNNPGEYDCYQRAEPDEPMFTLLGRDPVAGETIKFWARLRTELKLDLDEGQAAEARQCVRAMEHWASEHGKRGQLESLWVKRYLMEEQVLEGWAVYARGEVGENASFVGFFPLKEDAEFLASAKDPDSGEAAAYRDVVVVPALVTREGIVASADPGVELPKTLRGALLGGSGLERVLDLYWGFDKPVDIYVEKVTDYVLVVQGLAEQRQSLLDQLVEERGKVAELEARVAELEKG